MSRDGVHENDMSKCTDDQWPADDPALAAFAEDLRIVASGPAPEPRPGLVAVMRQGAVPIESPTAGRSKKMLVKTLLGTLAAKTALGLGVAAASVTAAGAAGVLPGPAQDVVSSVVSAATPFELPNPSDVTTLVTDDPDQTTTTTSTTTTLPGTGGDDGTGGDTDAPRTLNHGACVSAVARSNAGEGNHGRTVSSVARSDCGKTDQRSGASTTSTTVAGGSTTSTTITTSTVVEDGDRTANRGRGNSGNGNPGNGGNRGNGGNGAGNSARGNSGRN